MSKHRRSMEWPEKPVAVATVVPLGDMVLSGIVKTSRGYAVATAVISDAGELLSWKLGNSQAYKQFVAVEHKAIVAARGQKL